MTKAKIDKDVQAVSGAPGAQNPEIGETVPMVVGTLVDLLTQSGGWYVPLQNSPVAQKEPEKVFWHVEVLPPDPHH